MLGHGVGMAQVSVTPPPPPDDAPLEKRTHRVCVWGGALGPEII